MLGRGERESFPEETLCRSSGDHLLGLIKYLLLKALPGEGSLKLHALEVDLGARPHWT